MLSVLGALWRRLPPPAALEQQAALRSYVATLAPLSGSLTSRGARAAVASAYASLAAGPLPEIQITARLLAGMVATSDSMVRSRAGLHRQTQIIQGSATSWLSSQQRPSSIGACIAASVCSNIDQQGKSLLPFRLSFDRIRDRLHQLAVYVPCLVPVLVPSKGFRQCMFRSG